MLREHQSYWHFGPQVSVPLSEGSGLTVRIRDDMRKAVVFVGFRDSSKPGGFRVEGTGFFIAYGSLGYFVTCKHVADTLGETGFVFRFNLVGGRSSELIDIDEAKWFYHDDENVDLAVACLDIAFGKEKLDHNYLDEVFIRRTSEQSADIGIGDFCYTVGLYRFLPGTERNVPIVHVGHIALMAGEERIPVRYSPEVVRNCDSHLVEGQGVHGISGSPVFVRASFEAPSLPIVKGRSRTARLPQNEISLFGIWQSSWFASPDLMVQYDLSEYEKQHGNKPGGVSIGKGAVVPVSKLIDILENDVLKNIRKIIKAKEASQATSLSGASAPTKGANPTHREDFKSLLKAASKTPPQDD